ncbi:patellin-3-like [Senna tora]|uniref:Patellin-3-like n=1 Tax=Senna tora TaxID=362788 RepID=A0A835CBP8_9FABA|nr:patellin-3-like [Senna tora]
MADDASKATTPEEVVLTDVPQPEKKVPEAEAEKPLKPVEEESDDKMPETGSFKEESTIVAELAENEKKALQDLKLLIQEALNNHEFSSPTPPSLSSPKEDKKEAEPVQEKASDPEPVQQEETRTEDAKTEETKTEEKENEEADKETETAAEEVKEPAVAVEEKSPSPAPPPAVDDDGAKTVEAIEETIVAVSASSVPAEQPTLPAADDESKSSAAAPPAEPEHPKEPKDQTPPEEVSIWGIPLLADDRTDVILLKFLRARDFKVKESFSMIKNTIRWRKEFKIDELMEENLGDDLNKAVYMHGFDKEGHPVCYNIYGEFQNKELYKKTFSDEGKRQNFLRWRIQFLEKSIRKLDFNPGGISTIVQVNDLKNSPGPGKWELRNATKQALHLLQDNYPEFVFINVPWWYLAVNRMISPFLTQRTKSKFVFAGPSKSAETLLRYIAAEQLPVKYGGLSKEGEFGNTDAVTEITVRPAAKHTVEFPVNENPMNSALEWEILPRIPLFPQNRVMVIAHKCVLSWEVRVIGWDVSYGAEFVPSAEGSYTVIIQKGRKVTSSEEPVVCNSFEIGEPGKVVLTIDNPTSKKKKLLYRLKTKPSSA